ncbi:protein twist-like isoform X2 [Odontomachus brunneus]|uniref:protein twist-like isoform X2 n=1 Tax=Odontomachus brunneus TaxID=486640 RepID=UPI0013F2A603|nr:protein twist-like isoform X2 [Odontomachus brunneus]
MRDNRSQYVQSDNTPFSYNLYPVAHVTPVQRSSENEVQHAKEINVSLLPIGNIPSLPSELSPDPISQNQTQSCDNDFYCMNNDNTNTNTNTNLWYDTYDSFTSTANCDSITKPALNVFELNCRLRNLAENFDLPNYYQSAHLYSFHQQHPDQTSYQQPLNTNLEQTYNNSHHHSSEELKYKKEQVADQSGVYQQAKLDGYATKLCSNNNYTAENVNSPSESDKKLTTIDSNKSKSKRAYRKRTRKYQENKMKEKESEDQREVTNAKERQRTQSLNEAYDNLRKVIPIINNKFSKMDTLKTARKYIEFLKAILHLDKDDDPQNLGMSSMEWRRRLAV